ncbi:hypothetical protein SDC9_89010 [bioreactor metagenome]|uniref:Uncharacterized protein n=1 Tax=bioreactor metagenome TaxID=1076179 RepID=A0A644ZN61_9ZZZZ
MRNVTGNNLELTIFVCIGSCCSAFYVNRSTYNGVFILVNDNPFNDIFLLRIPVRYSFYNNGRPFNLIPDTRICLCQDFLEHIFEVSIPEFTCDVGQSFDIIGIEDELIICLHP